MGTRLIVYALLALFLTAGCSNTKHLAEGELLYLGASVEVDDKNMPKKQRKALQKELENLTRPIPNKKILGLRPKLYFYNLAGEPKKEKGFRHWLRNKVGEPPVTFGKVDLKYNTDVLQSYAENKGYFQAFVTSDSTRNGKKATAEYIIKPGPQWKIKNVIFPSDSTSELEKAVTQTLGRRGRRGLLKPGEPYDLDVIKAERERIDARLKEKGYYFFNPEYLKVQVDSTVGKYEVDLLVKVKDDTPQNAREVYKINDIYIYQNYSINEAENKIATKDSVMQYKDLTIIDTTDSFNPRIYDRTLYFHKGDIYNRTDHNLSLNRLVNLGTFKFVKNQFKVSNQFTNMLDAYYYLTPLPKKSIRVEVLGKTNSANYTGSELNVNWSNRNTFKGAELLTVSVFGGLEVQVSGQNKGYNVYRVGGEVNLFWPRIIAPIKVESASGFVPRTKAMLGYEYQKRIKLYALNTFRGSFGYQFKENVRKEHQLNLLEVTYVSPANVTELYQRQADTVLALQRVIDKQLIFGPTYSYTYTNTMRKRLRNTYYFKGLLEESAIVTGLATGANIRRGDTISVLNVPFSQFVKAEVDFRHYLRFGDNTQLASRVIVGAGIPFGNSRDLPFIKQFFSGGTNSIRAFRARSIGPGTFKAEVDENAFLPDESGDLKFEFSTELRQKLVSVIHGALFLDAGNVWLMNDNPDKPGGKFSGNWLKELAVGTGAGLRIDISLLVLRLDLAFPLRKPYLAESDRWVLDQINFGSRSWRKENLVFNLAIGYPF
ncbi:translocation and assembly module lipoprotein TamL [Flavobacterium caeni]|uniref:Outer membrane protein assembly factor BamA n=1 Tax=Flavobacterium caeni TaxID=490189 RepID=A0A1G5D184_9FLAO|nr:BamA/TamA family outer membrane protein [Flavobacterium caeni]SCY08402.1 Outer membrane protein assembly factor BamA [Flavobacterium caeni]